MPQTTALPSIGHYVHVVTLADWIIPWFGDYAADFDIDGIVDAVRDQINSALATSGISMHGDEFYSVVPVADDADELIRDALDAVDLGSLLDRFERPRGGSHG